MCVGNRFIFTELLHSMKAQLFSFVFFELLMFFNITSDVLIKDIMLLELLMFKKILFNRVTLLLISCNVTLSLYAIFKVHSDSLQNQVENTRVELVTSCLQGRRSPN